MPSWTTQDCPQGSSQDFNQDSNLVQAVQLDSGLTLIHQQVTATPVTVVDVWVHAGVCAEPHSWPGSAHFLEHMIFKGTPTLAPGMFDWMIEGQGGVTNAVTSHDHAHYFMITAATDLAQTLPYLADLLLNAAIPITEFEAERQVILAEIAQMQANPDWQVYHALLRGIYGAHPYGRPVLGSPEQVQQRSASELRLFHQMYYQPNNMTLVVVGDVSRDRAIDLASKHFQALHRGSCFPSLRPRPIKTPLAESARSHCMLRLPGIEQARLMMAWLGPSLDELEDGYGLDVLATLLTGGRRARLVQELCDQRQWIYSIDSSFTAQHQGGIFTISAWLPAPNMAAVKGVINETIAELQSTLIQEEDLQRCQRLLCHDFIFSTETPSQLAGIYGYYGVCNQLHRALTYATVIQKMTPADVQRLAQQYLTPRRCTLATLEPDEAASGLWV
ncbi:insulinase family protein [Synechococcales cyanobacterium C]|uniref:Insulinase family protein n=2 Tax=Petrachloros TaxID=2918834 RepID=A0A8K2AC26_9CYAN|nr:insulinase family protein [Petrachloros mirabilis ULC683]